MATLEPVSLTKLSLEGHESPREYLVLKRVKPLQGTHDAWVDVTFSELRMGDVIRWPEDVDTRFSDELESWRIIAIPRPPRGARPYLLAELVAPT